MMMKKKSMKKGMNSESLSESSLISENSSEHIRDGTSAGLRKTINREVKKILHNHKGKGGVVGMSL